MSEREYGPFEPPVTITDVEWRVLEVIRRGRTVSQASSELGMSPQQLRFFLANVGQKLTIAAKL